jgi:adenylate kinase
MYIILLGAPGAGKGTQAAYLAQKLNLVHIATGDLFRQAIEQETQLGLQVKSYTKKGLLVPDEITIRMLLERISALDCAGGVIFDGFPRNLEQARALDEALAEQDKAIDSVVYIKVSEEELVKRLSGRRICRQCQVPYHIASSPPKISGKCDRCGGELYHRPDDNVDIIKKRLEVYFAETAPLVDYYTRVDKLVEANGKGDIEEVAERVILALKRKSVAK